MPCTLTAAKGNECLPELKNTQKNMQYYSLYMRHITSVLGNARFVEIKIRKKLCLVSFIQVFRWAS